MLHASLGKRVDILFVAPLPKGRTSISNYFRALRNLVKISIAALRLERGGRVLMFSSAGYSFFEKILWGLLVAALGRKPVLAMIDGNFPAFWERQRSFLKTLVRRCLFASSVRMGAQSQSWVSYYSEIFPNLDVIEFSATVEPIFLLASPRTKEESQRVLYVGWMIEGKGVLDLLDAFVQVLQVMPDARLRLIGPQFGKEAALQREFLRRGLKAHIDLVGPIADRQALMFELRTATVFVLPSHAEGLPVALLEAMAMGAACVATDVGAIPDVLDHGAAGLLVPVRAPRALSDAICSLLASPTERDRLATLAHQRIRSRYSIEMFVASYLKLLELE